MVSTSVVDDGLAGLGKRSALALVSAGLSGLATIAILVIVSRTLTPSGSGEFFVAVSVFAIAQGLCSLGAETSLQYFVPTMDATSARRMVGVVTGWSAAAGIIVSAVVWWSASPIGRLLSDSAAGNAQTVSVVRTIALVLPFAGLYEITMGALQARDDVLVAMVLDRVARPVVQVAAMIVAGVVFSTSRAAVLAWAVPHAIAVVVALALLARPGRNRATARGGNVTLPMLYRYTWPRSIARVAQTLTQRLDLLILAAVYPLQEAGIYGTVSRCMIAGVFVATALRQTIQPQLRRLVVDGDRESVRGLFELSTTWLVLVSWPVYLVMITHASLVLRVFGAGYERGAAALVLLSIAMLIATACGLVDVVLLMLGRSWLSTVNVLIALLLNVFLNLMLAPRFGMIGSAVAWMVAILTTNLLPLWQTSRIGLTPAGRPLFTAIAVVMLTIGAPMSLERAMFGTSLTPFIAALGCSLALYGAALRTLRRRVELDRLVRDLRRPRRQTATS
jgi:O-antigen/teichoic acid export membrane protein